MSKHGITGISGVAESRSALMISEVIANEGGQALIITATEKRARSLADDLSFFTGRDVRVMPNEDQMFLDYEARNHDLLVRRLAALKALRSDPECIVVAPASAAVKKVMPHRLFESKEISIRYGEDRDPEKLKEQLVELGYERRAMVEGPGEFSLRGGILDIYPPDSENPFRVEFFDTEVDSIRSFDIDTQRSQDKRSEIIISPAQQMIADERIFREASQSVRRSYTRQAEKLEKQGPQYEAAAENLKKRRDMLTDYIDHAANVQLLENYLHYFYKDTEYLWDYMKEGLLFIDDPDRIYEFLDAREKEQKEDSEIMLEQGRIIPKDSALLTGREDLVKAYSHEPVWIITPFPKQVKGVSRYTAVHDFNSRQMVSFGGKMDMLEEELRGYGKRHYHVTIVCSTKERLANLREFLDRIGMAGTVTLREGSLSAGMDFPEQKIAFISDRDIFGVQKQKRRRHKKRSQGEQLDSFTDLNVGDYVVHENHGIGKFLGIEQLDVQGEKKDYLKLQYAGSDLLYVPVEQFDIVQKYIGSEGKTPKMNKLAGSEWKTAKAKARAAIAEMADELIDLYAQRQMAKGYAFGPDTVWQKEFEDSFPYVETDDQLRCIEEIKADMEQPRPMDRLLCGDVGFGKTEVAARAVFKCLQEGKQAAVLVPTTLLANQHYYTFTSRFENFPMKVEMLSRFRSAAEQKQILKDLEEGKIDLIVGTHRLLSSDVKFKDLGLLVVDEEQRFGVAHKEKIKKLKSNVDVLTLTATPIPRTLNMSLTGIRDMSVIEEPPEDRYPVQTYVMEQDDGVIREAIIRETDRGGQVFVVYNRVQGIHKIAERIQNLVPDARVVVGHGRMSEQTLEDVMLRFDRHEYDVLVATTIIESGIDVPNANTLIVLDADRYGLSQLYQIRGRVGRSTRMAYAYLMYQREKVLTEVAEKRLRAIREFTEFGSGFKVAMRDLQIRGAGNLLGSEQSGHMMNIGYELYCKLVNEAVQKRQGKQVNEAPEECSVELAASANIPGWYIEDEAMKIEVYKKIARVRTPEDEDAMFDELVDRFGDVPQETMNLVKIARIRGLAEDLSVKRIYEQDRNVIFAFEEKNPLTAFGIVRVNEEFQGRAFVHGGVKPFIRIPSRKKSKLEDSIRLLTIVKEEVTAEQERKEQ